MPRFRITTKTRRVTNGIIIEPGMSVEVITQSFCNPVSNNGGQAVADALVIEQNLLDGGMCTRDWSIEQIKNIYKFGKKGGLCQEYGYC